MPRVAIVVLLFLTACASPRTTHVAARRPQTPRSDAETTAGSCGTERWNVKTGADADASKVPLSTDVHTTIAALRGKAHPSSLPSNNRVAPVETTDWWVSVTLVKFKTEADSDIHLVIADSSNRTMIAELPSPSCVSSSSPMRTWIAHARSKFAQYYTATGSWHTVNRTMKLRGAGFFDFLHGQTGVAPNGIEIHPIFDFAFP